MQSLKFREWDLVVDNELTQKTYSHVRQVGTESCGCNYCKNFIAYRDKSYPIEILQLFNDLGIDYKKEFDASQFCKEESGLHLYFGWFNFKGNFLGKDSVIPLPPNGHTLDLTTITANFSIGFSNCKGGGNSYFENKDDDLVQIDFGVKIPWVIDDELENL